MKAPCEYPKTDLFNFQKALGIKQIVIKSEDQGKIAFDSLTHYLKPEEKTDLEQKLQNLDQDINLYKNLAKTLEQGDWKNLFDTCNLDLFPLQALFCLRKGLISDMTFSTSQLFYNVWTNEENQNSEIPMRFISVFNKQKQRSRLADGMIDETMTLLSHNFLSLPDEVLIQLFPQFKESDLAKLRDTLRKEKDISTWDLQHKSRFIKKLGQLCPSEQSFLLVVDKKVDINTISAGETQSFRLGFNAFSRLYDKLGAVRMIPSRGMMQAYLEARFPTTTPKPVYRLALSTIPGMHKTLKADGRDMFQSFKMLPQYTPASVDNNPVEVRFSEAEMHDFYHQMRIANIPRHDRDLLNLFADKLLSIAGPINNRNKVARAWAIEIIDMDIVQYDINYLKYIKYVLNVEYTPPDPIHLRFWHALDNCLNKVQIKSKSSEQVLMDMFKKTMKQIRDWIWTHEFGPQHQEIINSIVTFTHPKQKIDNAIAIQFDSSISMIFKTGIEKKIENETLGASIHVLIKLFSQLNECTLRGRLLKKNILEQFALCAKERTIKSIQACYYDHGHSPDSLKGNILLRKTVITHLIDRFTTHMITGLFAQIQENCPKAFAWMMTDIDSASHEYDVLLKLAIQEGDKGVFLFDLLYRKSEVNRVFQSDQQTLLHRALAVEDMELMMKLTNDGARTINLSRYDITSRDRLFQNAPRQPYSGMSPMEFSVLHGREEFVALMAMMVGNPGGWMKLHPEYVDRFRRMDFNSCHNLPQNQEDLDWAEKIIDAIPSQLYSTEDVKKEEQEIQKLMQYSDVFWTKIKEQRNGHIPRNQESDDFFHAQYRLRKWKEHGGKISDIKLEHASKTSLG